jgi:MFS family permease
MRGWRRTFWVVFVANLVSGAGLMSFLPYFPTLLAELGLTDPQAIAVWSGILFGVAPLAAAFSGPLWGSFGDRYGRKLMVVRSLFGLALFVGAMTFARTPWELLALRILQGSFSGYMPPSLTLVSVSAPPDRTGQVTSWIQTASTFGTILGPLLGVILLERFDVHALFATTGIGAGVSGLLVLLFAREDERERASVSRFAPGEVLRAAWRDLRALAGNPAVRTAMALYAAVHFALGATQPLTEFLVEATWRGDPGAVERLTGALFSVLAITAIVATPVWGWAGDRFGHGLALRCASVSSAVALIAHALAPSYAWLFAVRLLFGLASPGASASAFGLAATTTGRDQRGAAMGAVFSARCLALAAGSFLGGTLMGFVGIRAAFALAGGAIALALLAGRGARQ